jgi:hypothetical protein
MTYYLHGSSIISRHKSEMRAMLVSFPALHVPTNRDKPAVIETVTRLNKHIIH